MSDKDSGQQISEEEIARLLGRVGPLATPSDAMTREVKAAVKDTWRQEVKQQKQRQHSPVLMLVAFAGTSHSGLYYP